MVLCAAATKWVRGARHARARFVWGGALSWVDGTRFAFPSYGFFGRLKGLFLRLDLAMAGRRAEGCPRSPQATAPLGAARGVSVLGFGADGRSGWV